MRQTTNVIVALLDGMTGAGLFRRLNYPGAPQYAIDPRPIDEIIADMGWNGQPGENKEATQAGDVNATVKVVRPTR